jgi:alkaline phosphatase
MCNKKLKYLFLLLFLAALFPALAQKRVYDVSNAHSHNDYEQRIPFWMAYHAGFGSIEADIFLVDGVLLVAHDSTELRRKMKLETAYLMPLLNCLQKNNGHPYRDKKRKLQVLIDIKTDSIKTLNALIILLRKYPSLIKPESLRWVITGNRPDRSRFTSYPDFIMFDGEISKSYTKEVLTKISLMSDNFKNYSLWNGENGLPEKDSSALKSAVNRSHRFNKPVRLWNAPDEANAWRWLMLLEVDYINTDHIDSLADFLNRNHQP